MKVKHGEINSENEAERVPKRSCDEKDTKIDYKKTGMVTILEWAQVMEAGTGLHVPWLMDRSDIIDWDEMDLETNEVNYQQFLFDKGLTEKKDSKKRNVQAYVLKFSRPLYIYFDGTKTGEEAITKESSALRAKEEISFF